MSARRPVHLPKVSNALQTSGRPADLPRTDDQYRAIWDAVIARTGPAAVDALVTVLDRARKLDQIKDALLVEFAAEVRTPERTGRHGQATRWLQRQLADGEQRSTHLRREAVNAGIPWRRVEAVKAAAGAQASKHGNASWWSLQPNSATPSAMTPRGGNLTTDE
jgi:hypothetical protein